MFVQWRRKHLLCFHMKQKQGSHVKGKNKIPHALSLSLPLTRSLFLPLSPSISLSLFLFLSLSLSLSLPPSLFLSLSILTILSCPKEYLWAESLKTH